MGDIVEISEIGGLHHRHERRAARPAMALLVFCANGEFCPGGDLTSHSAFSTASGSGSTVPVAVSSLREGDLEVHGWRLGEGQAAELAAARYLARAARLAAHRPERHLGDRH